MAGSPSSTSYEWDEDGNRTSGAGMTYTYDGSGRMKSLASGAGTMVEFAYDPRGGLASATNLWSVVATASVS